MFTPKAPCDITDGEIERLWDYLGCLYQNGQIYKDYELVRTGDGCCAFVTTPEADSLDKKYDNHHGSILLEQMEAGFALTTGYIGLNLSCSPACGCDAPSWYLLYTSLLSVKGPVVCGDCGNGVPLYKLPGLMEGNYPVVNWESTYKSVDKIWFQGLSDRFSYRQMNSPDSQLSRDGRQISADLEQATGKPFYYYLFHYEKTGAECPLCGRRWKRTPEGACVGLTCEACRLAADEA